MVYDQEDFTMSYPEPPAQGVYPAPADMSLSPDPYYTNAFARPAHDAYPTTLGFENAMYAEAPFMHTPGRQSPPNYADEGEMRVPTSSNLSTASASSSTMGSPLSNHGQLTAIAEWAAPQGLGVSPGIVDHSDYFPGTEYSFVPQGMDFNQFEYATASKPPGYVGELSRVPRSSLPRPSHQGSVSSSVSSSTVVGPLLAPLDTRMAQDSLSLSSSPVSLASSRKSSVMFASPSATSTTSFSSPTLPAWSSSSPIVPVDDILGSPRARPTAATPRLLSPFFSQSSGHFVAPLGSSYPSLIHPDVRMAMPGFDGAFPQPNPTFPGSPALSASPQLRHGSTSPFLHNGQYPHFSAFPAPVDTQGRRPSIVSFQSGYSAEQTFSGDEGNKKERCPHPDCGKTFKDLKAHMLTHQTERPEKCPIQTCDYHVKGFARKYDKNRHTLTHYKGTMVCGFCPGSGSAAEKSFNRADVFKRHLTAVHGVEQTPPNSRKKTAGSGSGAKPAGKYASDATGKCSTCSATFSNAQDFYEHLDDCVLRIVQQEDPAEAINAQRLAEVEQDRDVHATLEKNQLPTTTMVSTGDEEDEGDSDLLADDIEELLDEDVKRIKTSAVSPTKAAKGNPAGGVQKSRGMTHSRGGKPLPVKNRGRKNRRDYPSSWGFDKGQMTMKKRVLTVFEGPRRLVKDEMMLSTEHEVRVRLSDGKSYVTDLDVQTMKRAEGFLGATEEEKGLWVSDDPTEDEIKKMLEYSSESPAAQQ